MSKEIRGSDILHSSEIGNNIFTNYMYNDNKCI